MPRSKPARAKRPRAKRSARAVLAGIVDRAANVDAPLDDTADLLHALLVMGYGMIDNNEDGGKPIVAVVGATWEKLDAVRDAWREMVETARRQAGHSLD
jgi:hypothetical protein